MQYIPKGIPMHEKLSTGFVRVEALIDELRSQGFSGYVLLNFPQSEGYIWFSNGQVLNAVEVLPRERHAGKSVTDQLIRQAAQSRGTISIYNLQNEAVLAMAGIAEGQLVYENLTSDFASLGKLIKKISKEHKLHFISVSFSDQPKEGGLIYIEGDRVDVFCSTRQGDLTGSQALQQLVAQSDSRLAAFSLYRARGSELPAFDEKDVESSLSRLTQNISPVPPPPPAPPLHPQAATVSSSSAGVSAVSSPSAPAASSQTATVTAPPSPEITSFSKPKSEPANGTTSLQPPPAPEAEDILDVPDSMIEEEDTTITTTLSRSMTLKSTTSSLGKSASAATASTLTPVATPVTLTESKAEADMTELTSLMSQIIAAVERGMTVAGRGSSFPTALRAGLLAVTEQYPFLDPFAAEFEYHDREIVFVGSAQPEEFSKGLSEALRQMVEDLIYSSNGRVRDYISEELMKVERERGDDLSRFGLENITKRICQN
jgi:hypothetical protein